MNDLRKHLTPLNLFAAAIALLLVFDLSLATRLAVAWHQSGSDQSAQFQADLARYAQLQAQVGRLRSLPTAVSSSRSATERFLDARIPNSDASVVQELGRLAGENNVRLTRAQYVLAPAAPGLAEQRIDAAVSGPYTPLMHFINGLERDKDHSFFIIRNLALTGQQGGTVNLRLRVTTYMRVDPATAAIIAAGAKSTQEVQ
jgi:type IV pilus assembly protein PilO